MPSLLSNNWWAYGTWNGLGGVPHTNVDERFLAPPGSPQRFPVPGVVLQDDFILDALRKIPKAQTDFPAAYDALNAEEKLRIDALISMNPGLIMLAPRDEVAESDFLQTRDIR